MSEWREVNSATDSIWDREKPIEGVYTEKKEGIGQNASKMYHLKVGEETVGLWGSTVIDTKMSSIPIGSEVRIEPKGEQVGKSGKKYLDFSIFFRPAPMVEVSDEEPPAFEPDNEAPKDVEDFDLEIK